MEGSSHIQPAMPQLTQERYDRLLDKHSVDHPMRKLLVFFHERGLSTLAPVKKAVESSASFETDKGNWRVIKEGWGKPSAPAPAPAPAPTVVVPKSRQSASIRKYPRVKLHDNCYQVPEISSIYLNCANTCTFQCVVHTQSIFTHINISRWVISIAFSSDFYRTSQAHNWLTIRCSQYTPVVTTFNSSRHSCRVSEYRSLDPIHNTTTP